MKPAILLLAAAATIGAAPARPARHVAPAPDARYEAGGFEPTWSLVIEHGRLTFDPGYGGEGIIRMPLPRRQPIRNGYRYVTRELRVDVRHVRCQSYPGRLYADTVTVSGVTEPGCGGAGVAPEHLAYTKWYIHDIAGTHLPEESDYWTLDFGNGRVKVTARCQEYSGRYRERRPSLALGPLTHVAPPACLDARQLRTPAQLTLERQALAILRGPLRMSFVAGDTLVLTGPHGSLRLLQPG